MSGQTNEIRSCQRQHVTYKAGQLGVGGRERVGDLVKQEGGVVGRK